MKWFQPVDSYQLEKVAVKSSFVLAGIFQGVCRATCKSYAIRKHITRPLFFCDPWILLVRFAVPTQPFRAVPAEMSEKAFFFHLAHEPLNPCATTR